MKFFSEDELVNRNSNTIILICIVCVGLVLRLIGAPNIVFCYDEVSAISRLSFQSFNDLIEFGVKPDGHPAGVQVFLWYWSRLFGFSSLALKWPFILAGTLSIFVIARIGIKFFNPTVGLITAVFMACLQYQIYFSQIIRPYSVGLLCSSLLVYCWLSYFFSLSNKKYIFAFGILAACSAYIHYFSAFFAVVVALSGLFLIRKKQVIPYLLACLIGILLYLPHLSVTLYQFQIGGLDWLAPPNKYWLIDYLHYIFMFSVVIVVFVAVVFFGGIFYRYLKCKHQPFNVQFFRIRLLFIIWFTIIFLTGFLYSLFAKPVIQFSVLIFVFPFLLLFLFSWIPDISVKLKVILVSLLSILLIVILIKVRKHYVYYLQQQLSTIANDAINALEKSDETFILLNAPKKYIDFLVSENKFKGQFHYLSQNPISFKSLVDSVYKAGYQAIFCGNIPYEYVEMIREKFPYMSFKNYGFTVDNYTLSLSKPRITQSEKIFYYKNNTMSSPVILDNKTQWGPNIDIDLDKYVKSRFRKISVCATLKASYPINAELVIYFTKNGKTINWHSSPARDFIEPNNTWQTAYTNLKLLHVFNRWVSYKGVTAHIFLWNKNFENFEVNNLEVKIIEDNPVIYGLFEEY